MIDLQHLVDYFNDRYELEHHSSFRPFLLNNGQVSGLFGPVRLSSEFTPVRATENHESILGHIALLSLTNNGFQQTQSAEARNSLNHTINQPADLVTVINFDRLCRTVHLLNYLAIAHPNQKLFLDVDPRHVLAVKHGHGLYFEEVLTKCGLKTEHIVISMYLHNQYVNDFDQLLEGLNNYRRCGFQIAYNSNYRSGADAGHALVGALSPDYLRITAPDFDKGGANYGSSWVSELKSKCDIAGGQAILQQINNKAQALLASKTGFERVQGNFYDQQIADQLSCL